MAEVMQKYELRHSDGTCVVIKATNEAMARQFAMEKKHGPASANRAWPMNGNWLGLGLSVREITDVDA